MYRSTELNANLTKGTANLPNIIQLLHLWQDKKETPEAFATRAVELQELVASTD